MQLCPAKENAFAATFAAAVSRSASASTMTGVELPSSRLTRFRGARSRSFQPTPLEPVNVISAHPLVLHEDVADLRRGADEDVEPARREPGVCLELGEQERRERRLRGRLEDDGAAGCERRRDLVGNEVERKVERRDRAHDADRDADRHRELALACLRARPSERPRPPACAPRRPPSCTWTSRAPPRPWPPSSAFPPRR